MYVLVIKLGAIGDVIRTTAILPGLNDKYKDCKVDWVTKKDSFDILKNNNFINKIYLIGSDINSIKDNEYDLIINLDDDYDACKLISELKSKKIIGAHLKNNERTYTDDSSLWFDLGLISKFGKEKADELKSKNKKTYQEIMYRILDLEYKKQEPILILTDKELSFGKIFADKNKIDENNPVIGINTGAGGRWQDKKLSEKDTAELIDKLNNEISNAKLLLFGGPGERERNKKIKNSIKSSIIDAGCDNSLMEFASLINLCNILVTSDSLALHMGIALKKKIVAFFGPTSSAEIEIYDKGDKVIPKRGCLCCYKKKCDIPPEYSVDKIIEFVLK
jgi:heptosyltransferase-2|tara:strand:+ start:6014 stop:7015 length:1002 start_codon:yes stop_codon:yes gene_type:complete